MLSIMNTSETAAMDSLTSEVKINRKSVPPTPYGSIPKRNKKLLTSKNKKKGSSAKIPTRKNSPSTPYPCFSLAPTSSSFFISVFNNLFSIEPKEEKPVGFMPCSNTDKIQMSQIVDIAVSSSSPIDCHYGNDDGKEQDTCSSLSSSTSSSSSENSNLGSLFSHYMDSLDDENTPNSTVNHNSSSISTEILSDILCDHYVQTLKSNAPSSSDDVVIDVPLETFRLFEAPRSPTTTDVTAATTPSHKSFKYDWMCSDDISTREWKLIEAKQKKNEIIVQIQKEEKIPPVETDDVSPMTMQHHTRDIRANAAYLRMIVAEVNMMRSQKIVGPLRPRRVLPKRLDNFMHRPSPLQSIVAV